MTKRTSIVLGPMAENGLPESFVQHLKRERVRRRTYVTRDAARQDLFTYIEMFYNPTRKHRGGPRFSTSFQPC